MKKSIFLSIVSTSTIAVSAILTLLSGCTTSPIAQGPTDGPPANTIDFSKIPNAVPRIEPLSRGGNPETYEQWGKQYKVLTSSKGYAKRGIASWYGTKFHGRKTSNGEPYDMYGMSAAHKTLPLPTYLKVTNLDNQRTIIVRVNDRGPFHDDRIIDLSYVAAAKLDILKNGTAKVEISAVDPEQNPSAQNNSNTLFIHPLFVQIGAYKDLFNAAEVRDQLDSPKLPSVTIKRFGEDKNQQVYRVQFGPIYSLPEARQVVKLLAEKGFPNSKLVDTAANTNSAMLQ